MSHASWFMKPTISTSPLTWSCTTAGISPSNLEKSIVVPVQQKTPPLVPAGSALRYGELLVAVSTRAVLPAGRCGRGDGGRARGSEPWKVKAYQMAGSGATAGTVFTVLRRQILLAASSANSAAVTGNLHRHTGQRMSGGNGDDPRYAT